jgi:TonB family protein
LVNKKQEKVTGYIYDYVSTFNEGYAIIKRTSKYGLVNYLGEETIKPTYDRISPLSNGYTIATIGDSCTIIDTLGKPLNNQWYDEIDTPLTNFIRVVKHINKGGNYIRTTIKEFHLEEKIGLARDSVLFGGKLVSYITKTPSKINGLWFSWGEEFSNGIAKIAISKHTYFLDTLGHLTPRNADECDECLMNIYIPDELPSYPGGKKAFSEFIDINLEYPGNSEKKFHNGEVIVSFVVNKSGNIINPKIEKHLFPDFDNAVINVIKKMGKWIPAKLGEETVCYKINFPVRFLIEGFDK